MTLALTLLGLFGFSAINTAIVGILISVDRSEQ
jgi:hypothetical protein